MSLFLHDSLLAPYKLSPSPLQMCRPTQMAQVRASPSPTPGSAKICPIEQKQSHTFQHVSDENSHTVMLGLFKRLAPHSGMESEWHEQATSRRPDGWRAPFVGLPSLELGPVAAPLAAV